MRHTQSQREDNRKRMIELGLWQKVMKMPKDKRSSYIRGNLQVHVSKRG